MKRIRLWAYGVVACVGLLRATVAMAPPKSPDLLAYVANLGANNVTVIDTNTDTVVATITVGSGPWGVAITPDGGHVYVTNSGESSVSVIDTVTNTVGVTIPVGNSPRGLAITPNGSRVYVANRFDSTVSVIDTASHMVLTTISTPIFPWGVAITPDGTHAYVTSSQGNASFVSVIDTSTNMVVNTITLPPAGAAGVAITPDGSRVYVADLSFVRVIDVASQTQIASISVQGFITGAIGPMAIAFTPNGKRAYVTTDVTLAAMVIDTATNTVVDAIEIKNGSGFFNPVGIAVHPRCQNNRRRDRRAYVTTTFFTDTVAVIDTVKNTVVDTIAVGSSPQGVAVMPCPVL